MSAGCVNLRFLRGDHNLVNTRKVGQVFPAETERTIMLSLSLKLNFSCLCVALFVTVLHIGSSEATTDKDCKKLNSSCYTCTDNSACYWCSPSKQCRKYPLNSVVPSGCTKHQWFYKQCTVAGYWLIIVLPCLGVVLLISLGCCIWCCCCRESKAKKEERFVG